MHALRKVPFVLAFSLFAIVAPALAGGPLTSGLAANGSIAGPTWMESWTFSASAGERVVILAVTTSGAVNTVVTLRAPGGAVLLTTVADRSEFLLTSSGVHTIEVSDQGLNDAGTYVVNYLNVTAGPFTHAGDTDGGSLASAEARAATMGTVCDLDAFTFSGTAGQRILFGVLETTATPFNVTMTLYPPGGGGQEASTSGGNEIDVQLAATGTYTVVVEDIANDHTGGYTVSHLNVSGGPHTFGADLDAGAIASATHSTGTMNGAVDWDAFTVTGNAGDRIVVVALTTSGTMNTTAALYAPNGAVAVSNTSVDRWDIQLAQSGTHTLVIEDQNFGETGTYTLAFLNVTSGPLTSGGDTDGGAIASGEVRTGSLGTVTDLDAFTFSGTAGQRVLFGALESTALPFNTTLVLYPPGGAGQEASTSGGNEIDVQLAATGTYTVVVEDIAYDHTGGYTVSHLNVSGGPHTFGTDLDGGAIASASHASGTMNGVVDWDAFTVTGSVGDRIVVVALTTSGTMNSTAALYAPNGAVAHSTTSVDRWDFQLAQSGTHTLVIEDQNFGETGTYALAFLNLTSGPLITGADTDGGAIASGEVRTGNLGTVTDLDAFAFSGTAGQRVLFGALESTVLPFNVTMTLYPPGGGGQEASTSGNNEIDVQLAATGTYTVVVEDIGSDHTGGYTVSHLNVSGGPHTFGSDLDGSAIASATHTTGTMNGVVDYDAFTLMGTAGDRILVVALTTSGTMNTTAALYAPNGALAVSTTSVDRWDFQLAQSGTHTLVIEDQNFGDTGAYALTWLNLTSGPYTTLADPNGGPIGSDEIRTGTIGTIPDVDAFTFSGAAGDRVIIGGVATAGASFNTLLTLYPPAGAPSIAFSSGGDRIDVQLPAAGAYVALVEDVANDHSGNYSVSYVNVTAGPVISSGDGDGGGISQGQVRIGTVSPAPDLDVYWFNTAPGDLATVDCVTTSGSLNTSTYLYPPGGGNPVVTTSADNWSFPITVGGRYALVVQHSDLTLTGTYQLGLSGSLTTVDVEQGRAPSRLALSAARPNPSIDAVSFTLELPRRTAVRTSVYDVRGARVRGLVPLDLGPGVQTLSWDGRDDRGRLMPKGLYLVRVETEGRSFTRRILRIE